MTRDPRHDILFEPVQIGPVTAPNRFYQVPHCTGMGWLRPNALAAMRRVKAEGGWGVVCTEYCSIHPSSDDLPYPYASLWDDADVRAHAQMVEGVHAHGALAGVELGHGGARTANLMTRMPSMDVDSLPNMAGNPYQTRAMDKTDIRNLRHWHRQAALRAKEAGFDIVYVYATHGYLLSNFLNPRINTRGDEYGGSLENRVRLIRELIEETKDAVGDTCAVAVRFAADEKAAEDGWAITGERKDMFALLAELPDLWDINIADYSLEMGTSRFAKEGVLEPYMGWIKSATTKPVVTVGRFTSPDTMALQVKQGITDFIGAARPSIADPFLPKKIDTGALGTIRECIGCNVCYSGDSQGVPIRCTQNPTMGEEWRKGWHPEIIPATRTRARVLVVGAGPAGLEAARVLGAQGHEVLLAEASRDLGGRVTREARLPGMNEYLRVRDYREQQLSDLPNVQIFRESEMGIQDVLDVNPDHVAIATGARWRKEAFTGEQFRPIAIRDALERVFTPDYIMDGHLTTGSTLVYDTDGYYMGSLIAERLAAEGRDVTLATPSDSVAPWAEHTVERWRIRTRLEDMSVRIEPARVLENFDGTTAHMTCPYNETVYRLPFSDVVVVSGRRPTDGLYRELTDLMPPFSVTRIGDCEAPAFIAAAVYAGHRYARELEDAPDPDDPMRHDRVVPRGEP
ncbi:MAG: FAD-dependent oxidoreductase [Paracoccaceae bacterium]